MRITKALIERNRNSTRAFVEKMKATTKDRFWKRVNVLEDAEKCWEWKNPSPFIIRRKGKSYPSISCKALGSKGPYPVHRVAFWLHNGFNPQGGQLCHKCGNFLCCNPHHIYHGTAKTNHVDAVNHGTFKPLKPKRGEENNSAKLTLDDARLIRQVYNTLKRGQKAVFARRFGIRSNTARRIAIGASWNHV